MPKIAQNSLKQAPTHQIKQIDNIRYLFQYQYQKPMGNQPSQASDESKVLNIDNISNQLASCQQIETVQCPIYGTTYRVSYQGLEFRIGKSHKNLKPIPKSIHYFIHPNILIIPDYQLLENCKISQYQKQNQLLSILKGVCEMAMELEINFSPNQIAYCSWNKKWGIIGQNFNNPFHNYHKAIKQSKTGSLYLSPQLMKAFSKQKLYPKINIKKSNVFTLAIFILQIVFQTQLQGQVYNYSEFQIKLKPILERLTKIGEEVSQEIYEILIKMLEFDPSARISFQEIIQEIDHIFENKYSKDYSPVTGQGKQNYTSPIVSKMKVDSMSPSPICGRGRSPGAIKKNRSSSIHSTVNALKNEEATSRFTLTFQDEKLRKQSDALIGKQKKITPNRAKVWEGMENMRPRVEPFGLITRLDAEKKAKIEFKLMRS